MIEGFIRISQKQQYNHRPIYCHSKWFDNTEYVTLKYDDERLIIRKCYMEILNSAVKISINKSTKVKTIHIPVDVPSGTFTFDEESNEDQLVIYFQQEAQK